MYEVRERGWRACAERALTDCLYQLGLCTRVDGKEQSSASRQVVHHSLRHDSPGAMMESKVAQYSVIPNKLLKQNAGQLNEVELATCTGQVLVTVATKTNTNIDKTHSQTVVSACVDVLLLLELCSTGWLAAGVCLTCGV